MWTMRLRRTGTARGQRWRVAHRPRLRPHDHSPLPSIDQEHQNTRTPPALLHHSADFNGEPVRRKGGGELRRRAGDNSEGIVGPHAFRQFDAGHRMPLRGGLVDFVCAVSFNLAAHGTYSMSKSESLRTLVSPACAALPWPPGRNLNSCNSKRAVSASASTAAAGEGHWCLAVLALGSRSFGQRPAVRSEPCARHNKLVNRTCYGKAHRATISFLARCALPQQAGYRHRYGARKPGCRWRKPGSAQGWQPLRPCGVAKVARPGSLGKAAGGGECQLVLCRFAGRVVRSGRVGR